MFDREKQVIIDRYCKAIFHETDKITVSDLLKLNIPEAIKHYIKKDIEKRVEQEFREIKNFSRFDFDNIRVKPLVDELKVLLVLTKPLDQNELSNLLRLALDLNIDYLLRPCETLTFFVMKYEEFQALSVIKDRLSYVIEYEYFPIILLKYFDKTGITKINKNDFLSLLHKIDREYTIDFTILDHYNLFSKFKGFLLELGLYITDVAEYEAFIIYLNDKKQIQLAKFLEENKERYRSSGGNVPTFLHSILYSNIIEKQVVDKKIEASKEVVSETNLVPDGDLKTEFEEEIINVEKDNYQDKNVFQYSEEIDKGEAYPSQAIDLERVTPGDEIKEEEDFNKASPDTGSYLERNLDGLMNRSLRKKIVKKIFDNNEFEFYDFMKQINRVKNWDEASLILTELFDRKKIQPFSKWAIKFTEFLYENIK